MASLEMVILHCYFQSISGNSQTNIQFMISLKTMLIYWPAPDFSLKMVALEKHTYLANCQLSSGSVLIKISFIYQD